MSICRRTLLGAGALALMGSRHRAFCIDSATSEDLPAPKYRLAMNLEIMFPPTVTYEKRLEMAAKCGAKAFGFWGHGGKNLQAMLEVQKAHDMVCASISGNPKTGWGTGLTKTGEEQAFLDDFEETCQVAQKFGAQNLITFVGARQKDIPWETQEAQIVEGLKKAGAIAEKYNTYLTLEPLNRVESPQMTMIVVGDAYRYAAAAGHPRIKVDFDIYHRALGEGNVLNTLKEGLTKGYVRFVEVGDVPGRKEPGSGETNYVNVFRLLRKQGFDGFVGMEHGTTKDPQYAWNTVKALAGL